MSCLAYYNNYLYVTTAFEKGNIYKININDGSYTIFSTISGNLILTTGIVYYQNFLYVVAFTNYDKSFVGVYKIDISDGTNSLFISKSTYNFTSMERSFIAVDSYGNFYITDTNNVAKFDNNGNLLQSTFITHTEYETILFNNDFFYFTDKSINQISKYDINGTLITDNYATGGKTYRGGGIAFDSNGNFYVSNETNGGGSGNVTINILPPTPITCFLEGSKILTDKGYIPIQDLRKGDLVKTLKHDYKAIDMIGKRDICQEHQEHQEHQEEVDEPESTPALATVVHSLAALGNTETAIESVVIEPGAVAGAGTEGERGEPRYMSSWYKRKNKRPTLSMSQRNF